MSAINEVRARSRWVKHLHSGVNLRILLDGERGSIPVGARIIAEGREELATWCPLESSSLAGAIDEAKNYADQWVDQGMPFSGHRRPLNPEQ